MISRPVQNPPNPWLSTEVEYLGDEPPPGAKLEVYEEHTREILASNDSPDIGFKWSLNPYRGCFHGCAYCLSGDTRILLGDGTTRALADLREGDSIYGTERRGDYRRYVRTRVLAHWSTLKEAWRVRLSNGTELIASGDHRFLTRRGWKHVTGTECGSKRRPHLTTNDRLLGMGGFAEGPAHDSEYKVGYLCGIIRGDGSLGSYRYFNRPNRARAEQHHFRLALADLEALARARGYLLDARIETQEFVFQRASGERREMAAFRTSAREQVARIENLIQWPPEPSQNWSKGFLAGIFDAEGSYSGGILRISNTNPRMISETSRALERVGFDQVVEREPLGPGHLAANVRLRGGLGEHLRFFHTVDPAIRRKRNLEGVALKAPAPIQVTSIEPLRMVLPMFDITTGTGDFIANGVVSHNCYARPTHEYLGLGAGTDFERKITVKPNAPALLRQAFEQKSWQGELIAFSGVTDCYQPLEASYRLTRGCLQVCAEYRNPVGIITKAPLIERDLDLLCELSKVASVTVSVSIPIWDRAHAHAVEPYVATPQRRMETVARLAQAGLDVGVNLAPVIPGLGDEDIPRILEAAKAAGARRASFIFLRLPGSVKQVFEERLREALPLRADRVMNRVRDARGGKLYDSRYGFRQVGQGPHAEAAELLFTSTVRRLGLNTGWGDERRPLDTFRRPPRTGDQLSLL